MKRDLWTAVAALALAPMASAQEPAAVPGVQAFPWFRC